MQKAESQLNTERQKLAKEYAKIMRRLYFVELTVAGVLLLVLVFGGVSIKLSRLLTFPQPWASALYFVILVVSFGIITLPLSYYQSFILSHRYGLSNQKASAWLVDKAKAAAIGIILGFGAVIVIYWLLDRLPDSWWLWTSILLLLLSLLLTRLTPTLLLPVFFKLNPLEDIELERKLANLVRQARARVCGVFTIDLSSKSTTANAMLAGLGKTRRIILSDTLLQQYSPEEIEVILAHELGHHIHRDIPKLIAIQALTFLLAFYLADLVLRASLTPLALQKISDVSTFPLLVLFLAVFGLIITPLENAYSRHLEAAADKAALELTANPEAFITAMTKLTDQNLTEAQPSRWVEFLFYDHPPYTSRVDLAHHYLQKTA